MMDWLNVNRGALTVIATFVLVFVTGWYVHLTRELLKASYKPEVVVYLRASPTLIRENLQVNETTLCVKNTGQGVARKIEFGGNLSFAPYGGESLESIGFLKNGIDALALGQERRQSEPSVADRFGDLSQLQVAIKVTYEDKMYTGKNILILFLSISPSQICCRLKGNPNEQTLLRR